jgi:hypothetical protein
MALTFTGSVRQSPFPMIRIETDIYESTPRSTGTDRRERSQMNMDNTSNANPWPEVPVAQWTETRDTVHLWTQIVGKLRLALTPLVNHWWNVPLYVNSGGLTTSLMPYQERGLEVVFDFIHHSLRMQTTEGVEISMELVPRSVANFYEEFTAHLEELNIDVAINPMPTEIAGAIPFVDDNKHASYDADAMHRFWLSLVNAQRVLSVFRGEFRGKASPVHFFWGGFDLAVTRFSGRPAPPHPGGIPHCPDWVMVEAYRDEVSSCGYWPGGAEEGVFYSYAYPEPTGFRTRSVMPDEASYDADLGEFILPYAAVRSAPDPDQLLLSFLRSTFDAASETGRWSASL